MNEFRQIGDLLRQRRKQRRLNQGQLALAIGVCRNTIENIENNRHDPRFSVIQRIARYLEIDPKEFFAQSIDKEGTRP